MVNALATRASLEGVVVVGSCNEDMIVRGAHLPRPGETVEHKSFETCCGGKGANQAVQTALLLGRERVEMVGCLGKDDGGARQRAGLEKALVGSRFLFETDEACSGVALITVAEKEDGMNTIVVVPGANGLLTPQMVEEARQKLEDAQAVVCQLEVPAAASLRAFELAGGLKILNPAPIGGVSPDDLARLVETADVVCANEIELACLVDVDPLSLTDVETAAEAARVLAAKADVVVVATLGARGAVVSNRDASVSVPAHPIDPSKTLDTTGAGDSFLGALAAFLSNGKSLLPAARDAAKVAAWAVARPGTQPSYASKDDLLRNMAANDPLLTSSLHQKGDHEYNDPLDDAVRWPLDQTAKTPVEADLRGTGLRVVS